MRAAHDCAVGGAVAAMRPTLHATAAAAGEPAPEQVLTAALDALAVEQAHAEAARSRAAGMLTACGVLLALTVGLGTTAAQAAEKLSQIGAPIAVCAAAAAATCLLVAAVLSGLVFAPSQRSRTPVEELRDLSEKRFRVADPEQLSTHARAHLAAARRANLQSRGRILRAMAFYVAALGFLGAQALLIALVHLLGV
jgi:Na+/glutamate symporter